MVFRLELLAGSVCIREGVSLLVRFSAKKYPLDG